MPLSLKMAPVPPKFAKPAKIVLTTKVVKHNHQTRLESQKQMLNKAKSIAMQKASTKGLTQNDIDLEGMEADIIAQMEESGKTDIEMEDATPIIDAWI